jgi:hypothetical protein
MLDRSDILQTTLVEWWLNDADFCLGYKEHYAEYPFRGLILTLRVDIATWDYPLPNSYYLVLNS